MSDEAYSRVNRYAKQLLEDGREALGSGKSLKEASAAVRKSVLVNPLIAVDDKEWTLEILRNASVEVTYPPTANAVCVAATLAGDWLLALVSALLIDDVAEREAALHILRGQKGGNKSLITDLAEPGRKSSVFIPAVAEFCYRLVADPPEKPCFEHIETTPDTYAGLVNDLLGALDRYPLGEALSYICPHGSHSGSCLAKALSVEPEINALYEVSATGDIMSVPAGCREVLARAEHLCVNMAIDSSLWTRLRLARASAELSSGNIERTRRLMLEIGQTSALNMLMCLEEGKIAETGELAASLTTSADDGPQLVRELTEIIRRCFIAVASHVDQPDGDDSMSRGMPADGLQRNNGETVAVSAGSNNESGGSAWAQSARESRNTLREALELIVRDRSSNTQITLEVLGDMADRLIQRNDAYSILAKWLRLVQAERLYLRGRYVYSLRIFRYVDKLFAKHGTPGWVSTRIESRIKSLSVLESSEFTS
ncbi:hypothetical protein [Actinomyces ruminicola]|uniref:Uncharacterized protein n=1 Tax=Actinomyces ruminicola TaxID=332524 RepID=A0A1G9YB47_9ACTO|nr:hypothetical protein [Actinomyces ruminicola]SDN06240.1 hypothetical protein SAMN04487766_1123 [Actinomyces ruminicola]